jgi:hypothetical protein
MAGIPAFMTAEPITTKRKYANAILKAVEKSVSNHPYDCQEEIEKMRKFHSVKRIIGHIKLRTSV